MCHALGDGRGQVAGESQKWAKNETLFNGRPLVILLTRSDVDRLTIESIETDICIIYLSYGT